MRKHATALSLLVALAGCGDPQPRSGEPRAAGATEAASASSPSGASAPREKGDEPVTVTIRKGDRKIPEATYSRYDAGNVSFELKNADLEKMVLPLFSKQSGIAVEYNGPARKVPSLRLDNVPWRDALGILCSFTQTHVVKSQVGGRLELKLGYSDPAPFLARWDPKTGGPAEPIPVAGSGGVITSSPSSAGGASSGAAPGVAPAPATGASAEPEYRDPSQGYNDRVDELRRGVSTRSSGAK